MAWKVAGRSVEHCSCNMLCPCWLGPDGKPDQGWCGGIFGFDIREGNADGTDLSGTRVVLSAMWPANFFAGNGTARLYLSEADSTQQRKELEAIFLGKKGGPLAPLWSAVVKDWLPTEIARIDMAWGETPSISVDKFGQAKFQRVKDQAGNPSRVTGAAAQAAFQIATMDVAKAEESHWADPKLRDWQGDSTTLHEFRWSA